MTAQKNPATTKPVAKPRAKPALKAAPAARKSVAKKVVAAKPVKSVFPKKPASKPAAPALKTLTPAKAAALKPAVKAAVKTEKKEEVKLKKVKQVRDSFTMPETEYAVLSQVKKNCLKVGFEIKKSDLLRIGVSLIKKLETGQLKTLLAGLTPLKVGRPKK